MTKKIKIIDLLNKIANDEEVPSQIKYDDFYWNWCGSCKIYETRDEENIEINLYRSLVYEGDLNDEVEILDEEDEFEDIDEIRNRYREEAITNYKRANFNSSDMKDICKTIGFLMEYTNQTRDKIDSLIKNQKKIIERLNNEKKC